MRCTLYKSKVPGAAEEIGMQCAGPPPQIEMWKLLVIMIALDNMLCAKRLEHTREIVSCKCGSLPSLNHGQYKSSVKLQRKTTTTVKLMLATLKQN